MSDLKGKRILISQPEPKTGSPYGELMTKYGVKFDFVPFFRVEPISVRDFRAQKVNFLDYTAIVFSSRSSIDSFFNLCEQMRITVPETMKYFCQSEAIALYLQKYIVYRKRKIFFGNGSSASLISTIGTRHKGEKFLLTCTDSLKPEIDDLFTKASLAHGSAVLNTTVMADIKNLNIDDYYMMVFYSPTDVKSLITNFPEFKQGETLCATYGPLTSKATKAEGINIEIEAPTPQAPSIAQALSLHFSKIA